MSRFLRLLSETDKATALRDVCGRFRQGLPDARSFEVNPESFAKVPGKPFAYWVSEAVREVFAQLPSFIRRGSERRAGGYLRLTTFDCPIMVGG